MKIVLGFNATATSHQYHKDYLKKLKWRSPTYKEEVAAKQEIAAKWTATGYEVNLFIYEILEYLIPQNLVVIPRAKLLKDYEHAKRYFHFLHAEGIEIQKHRNVFVLDIDDTQYEHVVEMIKKSKHVHLDYNYVNNDRPVYSNERIWILKDNQFYYPPQIEIVDSGEMKILPYTINGELEQMETRKFIKRWNPELTPTDVRIYPFLLNKESERIEYRGNGMILWYEQNRSDKPATWWLRDENPVTKTQKHLSVTFQNRLKIRQENCDFANTVGAWYHKSPSQEPPKTWLGLVIQEG